MTSPLGSDRFDLLEADFGGPRSKDPEGARGDDRNRRWFRGAPAGQAFVRIDQVLPAARLLGVDRESPHASFAFAPAADQIPKKGITVCVGAHQSAAKSASP